MAEARGRRDGDGRIADDAALGLMDSLNRCCLKKYPPPTRIQLASFSPFQQAIALPLLKRKHALQVILGRRFWRLTP